MWLSRPGQAGQTPRRERGLRPACQAADPAWSNKRFRAYAGGLLQWLHRHPRDLRVTETRTSFRRFLPVPVLDFGSSAFVDSARLAIGACGRSPLCTVVPPDGICCRAVAPANASACAWSVMDRRSYLYVTTTPPRNGRSGWIRRHFVGGPLPSDAHGLDPSTSRLLRCYWS
jgi:hypothetical protein